MLRITLSIGRGNRAIPMNKGSAGRWGDWSLNVWRTGKHHSNTKKNRRGNDEGEGVSKYSPMGENLEGVPGRRERHPDRDVWL